MMSSDPNLHSSSSQCKKRLALDWWKLCSLNDVINTSVLSETRQCPKSYDHYLLDFLMAEQRHGTSPSVKTLVSDFGFLSENPDLKHYFLPRDSNKSAFRLKYKK